MPRPRTPTKVLEARGAFKKDPQRKRDGEPEVTTPLGAPHESLNAAESAAWLELARNAPPGVLTEADRLPVEMAACLLVEFRADRAGFSAVKLARLQSLCGAFGMTPSDRAKLAIEKPKDVNPFAALD